MSCLAAKLYLQCMHVSNKSTRECCLTSKQIFFNHPAKCRRLLSLIKVCVQFYESYHLALMFSQQNKNCSRGQQYKRKILFTLITTEF